MTPAQQEDARRKVVQYLNEAHASEQALTRVLRSQIAITPRGAYRNDLETHLRQTHEHAERIERRLRDLGERSNPLTVVLGAAESAIGQALALGKAPFDLLRGSSGEETVLKNAKDAAASEALEIATYTALERLARDAGDETTAALAASIRADEERMLARILKAIPRLTGGVVRAEVEDNPTYDITTTGGADAVREAGEQALDTARKASTATKRTARKARKVPGVAQAEGQIKGAVADAGDLAIARYDALTADEITSRLSDLSQIDLAKIDSYERRNQKRTTILSRITALRGDEPWPGYDELTAADVQSAIADADADRRSTVRSYERAHKNRVGVLRATDRDLATA